jgi:hypothetical protein
MRCSGRSRRKRWSFAADLGVVRTLTMPRIGGWSRHIVLGLLATTTLTLGACDDTTEDLASVRPGMRKRAVIERLGDGIPPGDIPAGLAKELPACRDARYYKSEYKARVARRVLGDPAVQSYWRVCFADDSVASVSGLGIITRAKG